MGQSSLVSTYVTDCRSFKKVGSPAGEESRFIVKRTPANFIFKVCIISTLVFFEGLFRFCSKDDDLIEKGREKFLRRTHLFLC